MRINIIGGGPAGMMAAWKLSEASKTVRVYEEHKTIGRPVQCTGIVTSELNNIIKIPKDSIVNRISRAKIITRNSSAVLPVDDMVIDRAAFDSYIAKKAKAAGAEVILGEKISKIFKNSITIGADGPASLVLKSLNPGIKMNYYIGKQAVVKGEFEKDMFSIYTGSIAPGFFGWVVPENSRTARIGIAAKSNTSRLFDNFINKLSVDKVIDTDRIIGYQAGLIPIYNPRIKTQTKNIYVVGDAAGQVKATTGGGLVPGLKASIILSDSIINNRNYEKEWRGKIGLELRTHLLIRKILDKLTDRDYSEIINIVNKEKTLFKKYGRDSSVRLALALAARQPKLLYYMLKIL